jgi:hypothetical protein
MSCKDNYNNISMGKEGQKRDSRTKLVVIKSTSFGLTVETVIHLIGLKKVVTTLLFVNSMKIWPIYDRKILSIHVH